MEEYKIPTKASEVGVHFGYFPVHQAEEDDKIYSLSRVVSVNVAEKGDASYTFAFTSSEDGDKYKRLLTFFVAPPDKGKSHSVADYEMRANALENLLVNDILNKHEAENILFMTDEELFPIKEKVEKAVGGKLYLITFDVPAFDTHLQRFLLLPQGENFLTGKVPVFVREQDIQVDTEKGKISIDFSLPYTGAKYHTEYQLQIQEDEHASVDLQLNKVLKYPRELILTSPDGIFTHANRLASTERVYNAVADIFTANKLPANTEVVSIPTDPFISNFISFFELQKEEDNLPSTTFFGLLKYHDYLMLPKTDAYRVPFGMHATRLLEGYMKYTRDNIHTRKALIFTKNYSVKHINEIVNEVEEILDDKKWHSEEIVLKGVGVQGVKSISRRKGETL